MEENNKVLLGMSGGTDSSVAAMLLLDAGYEVTGTTFRFFEKDNNNTKLQEQHSASLKKITIQNIWTTHESFAQDLAFRTLLTILETNSRNTS